MLLLTMREWFGPSRQALNKPKEERVPEDVRIRAFVTKLPIGKALRQIKAYEKSVNSRYERTYAINFELLQVATIDELDDEEIEMSRAISIEDLESSI